jgi:DNA-binding NtrC family response regulator
MDKTSPEIALMRLETRLAAVADGLDAWKHRVSAGRPVEPSIMGLSDMARAVRDAAASGLKLRHAVNFFDLHVTMARLQRAGGNISKASETLGEERVSTQRRLQRAGLTDQLGDWNDA